MAGEVPSLGRIAWLIFAARLSGSNPGSVHTVNRVERKKATANTIRR